MIILDFRDRRPIYEQIVERFAELMASGAMPQDSQMPSVRAMAMELSINPNTIQRAYAELERQGYIYSVKGKGSFVADSRHIRKRRGEEALREFKAAAERARGLGLEQETLTAVVAEVYGGDAGKSAAEGRGGTEHGAEEQGSVEPDGHGGGETDGCAAESAAEGRGGTEHDAEERGSVEPYGHGGGETDGCVGKSGAEGRGGTEHGAVRGSGTEREEGAAS